MNEWEDKVLISAVHVHTIREDIIELYIKEKGVLYSKLQAKYKGRD